jgi:Arylsulfotransferase (ASST)
VLQPGLSQSPLYFSTVLIVTAPLTGKRHYQLLNKGSLMSKSVIAVAMMFMLVGNFLLTSSVSAIEVALPSNFLTYTIDIDNNPEEGYFYMPPSTVNRQTGTGTAWAIIMDNDGNIKWFTEGGTIFPFPNQEVFAMMGGQPPNQSFIIYDNSYTAINTFSTNGYAIDGHDIIYNDDGTAWLIAQDPRTIDMSQLVPGGLTDAEVIGFTLQKIDSDGTVLWEYVTLDHQDDLPITDADDSFQGISFTASLIDYLHYNAIAIDTDGNLLASARHFSEIHKFNIETNELMWRMGAGVGNEFEFVNDLEGDDAAFYFQHDIRVLDNGNYTLFDNGNMRETPQTFAKEYAIDEETMTATLVWSYTQDPPSSTGKMGGAYRTTGGNTCIGWGGSRSTAIFCSEITPEGEIAWQITFDLEGNSQAECYRCYKIDMLGVAAIPFLYSLVDEHIVELTCNWFGHEEEVASYNVYVGESSGSEDYYGNFDNGNILLSDLTANVEQFILIKACDTNGNEISEFSNQITATPGENLFVGENESQPQTIVLEQNYPNPFNSTTTFSYDLPVPDVVQICVYNLLGEKVATLVNGRQSAGIRKISWDAKNSYGHDLGSGIYFYVMNAGNVTQTRKMLLVK